MEIAALAIMVIGGALLATDYRDTVRRFLSVVSPSHVLTRGFARAFGAGWAVFGVALIAILLTGH
ncbi:MULTISPECIES: hypothetical protein [unclassified Streptomyces]|uniref:hypothetical protein n=1 Tax=unclassified Streptomyces TaxID=2593676 RepID=UPI0003806E86|nr:MULTISPECIES: hypothetical protein [unclassified Streptomyces]MYX33431.1 hypothetical protein [Streptomyces sp. SID8377]